MSATLPRPPRPRPRPPAPLPAGEAGGEARAREGNRESPARDQRREPFVDGDALALLGVFLLSSSALWLALLKRPAHDVANELLALRVWTSDLLHAGDWPLWFPYARYGLPHTVLHFASNVFNPLGLILGRLFHYDVWTLAVEFAGWRAVGLAGAYVFARLHLRSCLGAAVAAVCYMGSGVVASAVWERHFFPGLATAPWLFAGAELALRARHAAQWCRAAATLALALAGIVWTGYPGTWLTAPFLLAPYVLAMALGRRRVLASVVAAGALAGALAAGMSALFIDETLSVPIYGSAGRFAAFAWEGALRPSSLLGLWYVSPNYLPGREPADAQPLYLGLVPLLLVIGRCAVPGLGRHRLPATAVLVAGGAAIAWLAAVPPLPAEQAPALGLEVVAAGAALAIACAAVPVRLGNWRRLDYALALTILWSVVVASPNPLADYLRERVPPFSLVRWNWIYVWVASLAAPVLGWRAAEQLADRALREGGARPPVRTRARLAIVALSALALVALAAHARPAVALPDSVDRMSTVELVWEVALAAVLGGAAAWGWRRSGSTARPLFAAGCAAFAGALLVGWLLRGQDDIARHLSPLPVGGRYGIDLLHQFAVVGALGALWWRGRRGLLLGLATIAVVDVSVASGRFLMDNPTYAQAQFPSSLAVRRDFAFSGAQRQGPEEQTLQYMLNRQATVKVPTMWWFADSVPHVARLDKEAGSPSIFRDFGRFPSQWSSGPGAGEATVPLEALRESVPAGGARSPDCPGESAPREPPGASVVRMLSSIVTLEVVADCARLMVFTDTWAPGWTVLVDGRPAAALRVNGAVRGVVVPAGRSTVEWRYRPPRLAPMLIVRRHTGATPRRAAWGLVAPPSVAGAP